MAAEYCGIVGYAGMIGEEMTTRSFGSVEANMLGNRTRFFVQMIIL